MSSRKEISLRILASLLPHTISQTLTLCRQSCKSPSSDYATTDLLYYPVDNKDDRLFEKDVVIGIEIDNHYKAYPLAIVDTGKIIDSFRGVDVVVRLDDKSGAYQVMLVDSQGETSGQINYVVTYWFAWVAYHRDTELFSL